MEKQAATGSSSASEPPTKVDPAIIQFLRSVVQPPNVDVRNAGIWMQSPKADIDVSK